MKSDLRQTLRLLSDVAYYKKAEDDIDTVSRACAGVFTLGSIIILGAYFTNMNDRKVDSETDDY